MSSRLGRELARPRVAAAATLVLILWGLLGPWVSLGDHPLYAPDEGRYARTTQLMVERGDALVPSFEGRPRLEKPPVVYWLQSAAVLALGENQLAVRLPSALFTTLALGLVFWIGRRWWDAATGAMALVIMAAMPLVMAVGRLAIIDPILAFFWLGATFAGDAALRGESLGRRAAGDAAGRPPNVPSRRLWLFWAMVGGAVLAKGPIGLIPAVVLALWVWMSGQRGRIRWWQWTVGLTAAAAPLLAWALLVAAQNPEALAIWQNQIIGRIRGTSAHGHSKPIYYYLPIFLMGMFPATALLPMVGWHIRPARAWAAVRRGDRRAYLAAAVVIPLILLSLMAGKLATYLLPLAGPTALIAACGLRDWLEVRDDHRALAHDKNHAARRLPDGVASIAGALTLAWGGGMLALRVPALEALTRLEPTTARTLASAVTCLAFVPPAAWAAALLWRCAATRPWALMLLAAALLAGRTWILAVVEDRVTRPAGAPALLAAVHRRVGPGPIHLSTFGYEDPTLCFYADCPVGRIDRARQLDRLAGESDPPGRWIVFSDPPDWCDMARRRPKAARQFVRLFVWRRPRDVLWVMAKRASARRSGPAKPRAESAGLSAHRVGGRVARAAPHRRVGEKRKGGR